MKKVLSNIWAGWKRIAHTIGRFQTRLLISLFYVLVISPLGLIMRLFGWDPLEVRRSKAHRDTNWKPAAPEEPNLDSMRRQS